MARPEYAHLEAVRKLRGSAHLTFPHGDPAWKTTERVRSVPIGSAVGTIGSTPDPEHAGTVLVWVEVLSEGTQYIEIYERFETLPGPEKVTYSYEPETLANMRIIRQRVLTADTEPVALDTIIDGMVTIDSTLLPGEGVVGELVTVIIEPPITGELQNYSRVEMRSRGFQFPARFTWLEGWLDPPEPPTKTRGPYPAITFDLSAHRTASKPAEYTTTYHIGMPTVPSTWVVTTPGTGSKFFPIGGNTIHNEWTVNEGAFLVEDIPASTPDSYDPSDPLTIEASAVRWKGNIFALTVVRITETP